MSRIPMTLCMTSCYLTSFSPPFSQTCVCSLRISCLSLCLCFLTTGLPPITPTFGLIPLVREILSSIFSRHPVFPCFFPSFTSREKSVIVRCHNCREEGHIHPNHPQTPSAFKDSTSPQPNKMGFCMQDRYINTYKVASTVIEVWMS